MIVPSGKLRTMVAQNIANPILTDGTSDINNSQLPATTINNTVPATATDELNGQISDIYTQPDKKNDDDDLTNYFFDKYVSDFNYIPRILQPLKNEFVEEEIDSGGNKKIIITLPSKYWGLDKRISHEDITKMIEEIQSKFKLYHVKTKINGNEIKMEFTSIDEASDDEHRKRINETDTSKEIQGLYGIYGKQPPGAENKSNFDRKSDIIYDLIKTSKNKIVPVLIDMLGVDNVNI